VVLVHQCLLYSFITFVLHHFYVAFAIMAKLHLSLTIDFHSAFIASLKLLKFGAKNLGPLKALEKSLN